MPDDALDRDIILAVLPSAEDCVLLEKILSARGWKIRFVDGLRRLSPSQLASAAVVLTEARLPGRRGWKNILYELQRAPAPPPLIVVDRLASEALWAEVLNLGGYDVLSKPLDATEVLHCVEAACNFRKRGPSFTPAAFADKAHCHVA